MAGSRLTPKQQQKMIATIVNYFIAGMLGGLVCGIVIGFYLHG